MNKDQLADELREHCHDPIHASSMTDDQIIEEYIKCPCCGEVVLSKEDDVDDLVYHAKDLDDFCHSVYLSSLGNELSEHEQAFLRTTIADYIRATVTELTIHRELHKVPQSDCDVPFKRLVTRVAEFLADHMVKETSIFCNSIHN